MMDSKGIKKASLWNKDRIAKLLWDNDKAVERAMVCLLNRQTQDEQQSSTTRHSNRKGFSCAHSIRGSYFGRWVKSGRRLSGKHLAKAREIALRYTQQLADEANNRVSVEEAEQEMQRIEAAGDRAQTRREEEAKRIAKQRQERGQDSDLYEDAERAAIESEMNIPREPVAGTYAATARWLVEQGLMTGDEADVWKDWAKDNDF